MDAENSKILIIKAKLLVDRHDFGGYIVYVFKNLNSTSIFNEYIMCTRFPNWSTPPIKIGETGFLQYREVTAGSDKWYDSESQRYIPYKYTGVHFINFIKDEKTEDLIIR